MDVEFHAFDTGLVLTSSVEVIALELKLGQFMLQVVQVEAEIDHRSQKHIAADAAENVEKQSFHARDLTLRIAWEFPGIAACIGAGTRAFEAHSSFLRTFCLMAAVFLG